MIGTFGSVTFLASAAKTRTFDRLSRSGTARWATHEVVGQKPATEFVGAGLEQITMSIRLDIAHGLNPRRELSALRQIRDQGTVETLVLGGKPVGKFALEAMNETWTQVDNSGRLLGATVELTLREYRETI